MDALGLAHALALTEVQAGRTLCLATRNNTVRALLVARGDRQSPGGPGGLPACPSPRTVQTSRQGVSWSEDTPTISPLLSGQAPSPRTGLLSTARGVRSTAFPASGGSALWLRPALLPTQPHFLGLCLNQLSQPLGASWGHGSHPHPQKQVRAMAHRHSLWWRQSCTFSSVHLAGNKGFQDGEVGRGVQPGRRCLWKRAVWEPLPTCATHILLLGVGNK